ncbi:FAD/NAD(P)-binding protein [Streptomyces sp. SID5910]|uniref:FAD/NAD(P)-binding protein n=1 Tax=Streptomyces sp. SID5910 TaxID=2690312 RepID=UPI00136A9A8D|nr:FAD-binding protein [Streptomyces sp. SID5910]
MLVVCLVGAGPRGLSVLERLCANERKSPAHRAVTVHVVEPCAPGPGKVWRTGQSRRLLMNTVASQVTVFTDHTVRMDGPVEEGPSLYAWAADLALRSADPRVRARFPSWVPAEAGRLGPDDYPTRAFYGAYLEDAYRSVREAAPAHVTVVEHRTAAVALHEEARPGGPQSLLLADGTRLTGLDAVVLGQGHVPARPTPGQRALAAAAERHGLAYFAPANPADLDLSGVAPGETVFVRGLGLNFFDVVALLTEDRGGTFVRDGDGRTRYRPSGREPRIVAGSRRGVPYHARGENQKGPHGRHEPRLLTLRAVDRLRAGAGERLDFRTDLWPLIAKEVESVYYGALLSARGRRHEREPFVREFLAAPGRDAEARLLDAAGIAPDERWDWDRLARPWHGRDLPDRAAHRAWLLDHLAGDVREARAGNVRGPLKAALDVLRDLRNEIRSAVDHGRLDGDSYRDDLQGWYTPLNAFLSIGPPVSRTEELIALIEAGVVEILGPGVRVTAPGSDDSPSGQPGSPRAAFTVVSDVVPGPPVRATVLIEARLPEPDLDRTADPLLRGLLESGEAAPFRIGGARGTGFRTPGLAVTERPGRVVDAAGRAHPRRFALGVPTEGVHWVTAAGIRPGSDSATLGDTDAVARAVLALEPARAAAQPAEVPEVTP